MCNLATRTGKGVHMLNHMCWACSACWVCSWKQGVGVSRVGLRLGAWRILRNRHCMALPLKGGEGRSRPGWPGRGLHPTSMYCLFSWRGSCFYPRLGVDREGLPLLPAALLHMAGSALSSRAVESVSSFVWTSARFSESDHFQAWPE